MKKSLAIVCLAALTAATGAAHAQSGGARGILGLGITTGGDTLASVTFTDGTTTDIKGGGVVHLYGGVEIPVGPTVSMQATLGYHVDDTGGASNGSLRFSRYPLELLAHVYINPNVRIGGGARFVNSAKLTGSGVLSGIEAEFDSTIGAVLEGEYLVTPNIGLKLRAVSEKYKPKGGGLSTDGNHVGFYFNWYL
jgi:hypothetical protein